MIFALETGGEGVIWRNEAAGYVVYTTSRIAGIRCLACPTKRSRGPGVALLRVINYGEGTLGGLLLHVFLELGHFVTDKAEGVVQREPLDIRGIFIQVFAKAIEFGQEWFGFHAQL